MKEVCDALNDDEKSFKFFERVNIWAIILNFGFDERSTLEDLVLNQEDKAFSTLKNYKLIVDTKGTLVGTKTNV